MQWIDRCIYSLERQGVKKAKIDIKLPEPFLRVLDQWRRASFPSGQPTNGIYFADGLGPVSVNWQGLEVKFDAPTWHAHVYVPDWWWLQKGLTGDTFSHSLSLEPAQLDDTWQDPPEQLPSLATQLEKVSSMLKESISEGAAGLSWAWTNVDQADDLLNLIITNLRRPC